MPTALYVQSDTYSPISKKTKQEVLEQNPLHQKKTPKYIQNLKKKKKPYTDLMKLKLFKMCPLVFLKMPEGNVWLL